MLPANDGGTPRTIGAAFQAAPAFPCANSYTTLPQKFFSRVAPTAVAEPRLIKLNEDLASELKLDWQSWSPEVLAGIFAGNLEPAGADPIALVYAGHQFGHFVPQLGDGRAILLGEVIDRLGRRRDIQLKGSGRTPYSRGGDGRAALGPVLREYVVSEAMHALGIPTTRSLAAVTTGEAVFREGGRLPGAIVTRVAASHVRVGTFQYFAARGDADAVKRLADYVIERHYPELKAAEHPYLELLRAVTERQAKLVASWMQVGFIHGVMNTDNMTVSGETIDFGPCAFMDAYDPAKVFSSIDAMGRYSYANQPPAAQWNLARFAETLLSLIDSDRTRAVESATSVISAFSELFQAHWLSGLRIKLGLDTSEPDDAELVREWLEILHRNECDFTVAFRGLCDAVDPLAIVEGASGAGILRLFVRPEEFKAWAGRWHARLAREPRAVSERRESMRRANPKFIPRNHRIEAAIAAAEEHRDFAPFETLLQVLSKPYDEQPDFEVYAVPPLPEERVLQTFCGT